MILKLLSRERKVSVAACGWASGFGLSPRVGVVCAMLRKEMSLKEGWESLSTVGGWAVAAQLREPRENTERLASLELGENFNFSKNRQRRAHAGGV